MKGTTHLILRGLSILTILFLLSTAVLIAQVKIKEKVKINPKINHTMKTNESSSNLPCFAGQVDTISDRQYITVLRPYIITATGTLMCEVRTNLYPSFAGVGDEIWPWDLGVKFVAKEVSQQPNSIKARIAVTVYDDGDSNWNDYCPSLAGVGKIVVTKEEVVD